MSEKKSRVSRYQRLHVGVEEFKKQQVVNKESIHRLHEMAQKVTTEDAIVDVNKKASTNGDMKVMETFAQEVNESKKHIQNHEPAIFIVEEENIFDEVEEVVEDEVLLEEVKEEVAVDELSTTKVLNELKEIFVTEEPVIENDENLPEIEEPIEETKAVEPRNEDSVADTATTNTAIANTVRVTAPLRILLCLFLICISPNTILQYTITCILLL